MFKLDFEREHAFLTERQLFHSGELYDFNKTGGMTWLDSNIYRMGKQSIAFRLNSRDTRNEIRLISVPNGVERYVSLSIYFPENFTAPEGWTVIAQWWQGSPASPNIALELDSGPNNQLLLKVVSRSGSKNSAKYKQHTTLPVNRGEWVDLIVRFKVDDTGGASGILNVWMNGNEIVKYYGPLGYRDLNNETNIRFGLYRSSVNTSSITAYYDEIRFSDRFDDVMLP